MIYQGACRNCRLCATKECTFLWPPGYPFRCQIRSLTTFPTLDMVARLGSVRMYEKPGTSGPSGEASHQRVFYGWYIVAAGTASSFIATAIFVQSMGSFLPEIRDDLGWSMAAISFGFSLRTLEHGLLAPVTGYLIDRLGPRLMASVGVIVMTAGLFLFSRMTSLWMLYLATTVMAIGQGPSSITPYSVAIMNWFTRKRGQASAFTAVGYGGAYIGVYPITLLLILFGWRQAAIIAALVFCVVNLVLAQVIRHRPQPYGYLPDGGRIPTSLGEAPSQGASVGADESFTAKDALRSRAFWLLLFGISLQSFHSSVYNLHMIPHMRNQGFSAVGAALVISFYGVTQVVGRPLFGWIGDKVGRYRLLTFSHLLPAVGWIPAAYVSSNNLWMEALYFMAMAPGHAAHRAVDQAVVADFFGTKRYGTIRGLISFIGMVGSFAGPLFGGFMFDRHQNYRLAFLIIAPLAALGTPALMMAGKPTLGGEAEPSPQA